MSDDKLSDVPWESFYSPARVSYISKVLDEEHIGTVEEPRDLIYVARAVEVLKGDRWKAVDIDRGYEPEDRLEFNKELSRWYKRSEYFTGTRLGRRPTTDEIVSNAIDQDLGLKFRVFYWFKHIDGDN
tara:strand:+ start:310 stop:693 length:384 start_codon:yes stop_codon:yes gene_type:complete